MSECVEDGYVQTKGCGDLCLSNGLIYFKAKLIFKTECFQDFISFDPVTPKLATRLKEQKRIPKNRKLGQ